MTRRNVFSLTEIASAHNYEQTLAQLPDRLNYSLKTLTLYLFQSIYSSVKYTLNL